jgi:hypothetical protein
MPKLLADENFSGRVLREIRRRFPNLEVVRVQDMELHSVRGELILEWAAVNKFVVLTHDVNTMTRYANERIAQGLLMPGLIIVKRISSVGLMVTDLELLIACTDEHEWGNHIWFVPI